MRRTFLFLLLSLFFLAAFSSRAAEGRVIKVLPHLLDLNGKHALAPSLYDRDAYQVYLREHTNEISGVRFDIQWKLKGPQFEPTLLRLELRGTAKGNLPSKSVLETMVKPGGWFSHWTSLPITGENYKKFGEVTAWRATLWEGDRLIGEQKSFLW
jgi:hypothetical protein